MAQKPGHDKSAEGLKERIARSRDRMSRELRGVRSELDVGRKLRRSFRRNTGTWVGAAIAVGVVLMVLPRRKKVYIDVASGAKVKAKSRLMETGFLLGALRIAVALLKPTIERFVVNKIRDHGSGGGRPFKW